MLGEVIRVLTVADDIGREHYPTTLFAQSEAHAGRWGLPLVDPSHPHVQDHLAIVDSDERHVSAGERARLSGSKSTGATRSISAPG